MICVSGGFTVLHVGHVRLIQAAAEYGPVTVILNSDEWCQRKYGYVPVPFGQRKEVLLSLAHVYSVSHVDDTDGTVCEALQRLKPEFFANGGDRHMENTPELKLCLDLKIKPLFNIGGSKLNSSSEILNASR